MERPPGVRPVSLAAPRIVVEEGISTKSDPLSAPPVGVGPIRRLKKRLFPPDRGKSNSCRSSTKNGRRSSNRVSNAVRLMTAGSDSTCPKSGLNVAFRLKLPPRLQVRSPPRLKLVSLPSKKGSLGSDGAARVVELR